MSAERYFVVFNDGRSHLLQRFLKRGFKHCFLLVSYADSWLILENSRHRLNFSMHDKRKAPHIFTALTRLGCQIIEAKPLPGFSIPRLGLTTCVGITKNILGIRDYRILTPWQLYCHILRTKHE